MGEVPSNGHSVKCPLCQGKGPLRRSELIQRLSDPGLMRVLQNCLQELARSTGEGDEAGGKTAAVAATPVETTPREKEVLHRWQTTKFLWRRSAKE